MNSLSVFIILLGLILNIQAGMIVKRQIIFRDNDQEIGRDPDTSFTTSIPPVRGTTTVRNVGQYNACFRACQTTNEYNPVCGSDRVTYTNPNRLVCAVRCGNDVQLLFRGTCQALR